MAIPSESERSQASSTGTLLSAWARCQPDRVAIDTPLGRRTFRELDENANRLAHALLARGLRAGDTVMLACGHRPELAEVIYACRRSGLRCAVVDPHWQGQAPTFLVSAYPPAALIVDSRLGTGWLSFAEPQAPGLRLAIGGDIPSFDDYASLLAGASASALPHPARGTLQTFMRDIGATPIPIEFPGFESVERSRVVDIAGYGAEANERHLTGVSLASERALAISLLGPLDRGVGVSLIEPWDAKRALETIASQRVTHVHLVQEQLEALMALSERERTRYDVSSLVQVMVGTRPGIAAVKRAAIAWLGPIVWEYFGSCEAEGPIIGAHAWLRRETSGDVMDPPCVRVLNDNGGYAGNDEEGEVLLKLEGHLLDDYHRAGLYDGWISNGMRGFIDADHRLVITERVFARGRAIDTGNLEQPVSTMAVQSALFPHPLVDFAEVVPDGQSAGDRGVVIVVVPDRRFVEGIDIAALEGVLVELDHWPGRKQLEEELLALCREYLPRSEQLYRLLFVNDLPRTATMQVAIGRVARHFRARRTTA